MKKVFILLLPLVVLLFLSLAGCIDGSDDVLEESIINWATADTMGSKVEVTETTHLAGGDNLNNHNAVYWHDRNLDKWYGEFTSKVDVVTDTHRETENDVKKYETTVTLMEYYQEATIEEDVVSIESINIHEAPISEHFNSIYFNPDMRSVGYYFEEEEIKLDWGKKPTKGYSIEITELEHDGEGRLTVYYKVDSPSPEEDVKTVVTRPEDSHALPVSVEQIENVSLEMEGEYALIEDLETAKVGFERDITWERIKEINDQVLGEEGIVRIQKMFLFPTCFIKLPQEMSTDEAERKYKEYEEVKHVETYNPDCLGYYDYREVQGNYKKGKDKVEEEGRLKALIYQPGNFEEFILNSICSIEYTGGGVYKMHHDKDVALEKLKEKVLERLGLIAGMINDLDEIEEEKKEEINEQIDRFVEEIEILELQTEVRVDKEKKKIEEIDLWLNFSVPAMYQEEETKVEKWQVSIDYFDYYEGLPDKWK